MKITVGEAAANVWERRRARSAERAWRAHRKAIVARARADVLRTR